MTTQDEARKKALQWIEKWSTELSMMAETDNDQKALCTILELLQFDSPTREDIASAAMNAGFMLSTAHGQEKGKLIPVSDTDTLKRFYDALSLQPAPVGGDEPVAWAREWEGDESDLGNMIVEFNREDLDDNP